MLYSPLVAECHHALVGRAGHDQLLWLHVDQGLALGAQDRALLRHTHIYTHSHISTRTHRHAHAHICTANETPLTFSTIIFWMGFLTSWTFCPLKPSTSIIWGRERGARDTDRESQNYT